MKIIGVTGGTGSGKSSVSSILGDLGAYVIDADLIAREVVKRERELLRELKEGFGNEIIDSRGELDRKKLGDIVFRNKTDLERLNNITHKYIVSDIINKINDLKKSGQYAFVVIDAPIPVEHGFLDISDLVVVVDAPEDLRKARIMERDGIDGGEAQRKIDSQIPRQTYLDLADHVIVNGAGFEELERETVKFWMGLGELK